MTIGAAESCTLKGDIIIIIMILEHLFQYLLHTLAISMHEATGKVKAYWLGGTSSDVVFHSMFWAILEDT